MTEWDPVSKQPIYKVAAVSVERIAASEPEENVTSTTRTPAPREAESRVPVRADESVDQGRIET
jgi:hypothetical protein